MIRIRIGAMCALGLACLWGCSQKQESPSAPAKASKAEEASPVAPLSDKKASEPGAKPDTTTAANPPAKPPKFDTGKSASVSPYSLEALKQKPIPPKPGEEWVPAKGLTALEAAKKIDKRVNGLAGVRANIYYQFVIASGRAFGDITQRIESPTKFSLQYPVITNGMPQGALARADGKMVVEKVGVKVTKTPVTQKFSPRAPAAVVETWRENAGREVLTGFLEHRTPFTELIQSLPKAGYTVTLKQRTLRETPPRIQYMIEATTGLGAQGKGLVDIILDGGLFLPLNFRVITRKPGEKADTVFMWGAQWLNKQKFDPKEFDTKGLVKG